MASPKSTPAAASDSPQAKPPVSAATALAPLLRTVLGDRPPVRIEFWDGSGIGSDTGHGTVRLRSVSAVRRITWAIGELGLSRAFVVGDLDVDGDIIATLRTLQSTASNDARLGLNAGWQALRAARQLGVLGPPPPHPPQEARPRGRRHSKGRDAQVISHHYDVGNDFYRLVLGPSLTYSCARFPTATSTLEEAQAAKHELVCRKLGLHERPGMRLLDIGCGWGSMAMHAATVHGASVVGVTNSRSQAELATERVAEAGLTGRVEIRVQDYRDLSGETFDAVSSIGMFEHVGSAQIGKYFSIIRKLVKPYGKLLNHAISSVGGSAISRHSFMGRYVFPDGELIDVGEVVLAMERAGFEVRHTESLREHYARTLRAWIANLESNWTQTVALVGEARARIWRLYLAGSVLGFEDGGISVHQVLGVVSDTHGRSGMSDGQAGQIQ